MLTHFQKWPLPGVKKTLMQGYTQRNKTKRKKEEKHKERETDRRREEDMTEGRSSFLRICMKMVLAAQRGKRCRRFESNTYQRQFWRARIPYLSRKTLEKGLQSWCRGCTSESWSSPFFVSSGSRPSLPHIHLKEQRKRSRKCLISPKADTQRNKVRMTVCHNGRLILAEQQSFLAVKLRWQIHLILTEWGSQPYRETALQ